MSIISAIKSLPKLISLKGASKEDIKDAENKLGLKFANEYKDYLSTFGAIIADGIELTGISRSRHNNVVDCTLQERELNLDISSNMYVIENLGIEGIVIWQNSQGYIFQTSPNNKPKQIEKSLTDYIYSRSKSYKEESIFESVEFI